jgi:tetratricopeptide (TPR) repeat protein
VSGLGELRRKQGRYREALDLLNRAQLTHAKIDGPDDIGVADAAEGIASLHIVRGEATSAFEPARRALEIRRKVFGNDHPVVYQSMVEVAAVLARMQRCAEARPLLDSAVAGFEKAQGTAQWGFQLALATSGECDLADGAPGRAVERVERAIGLARGAKEWPVGRGQYRWVLVRALWALGRRDDAIAAARQAELELAADADGAIDRAAVRAWLAAHAGAVRASGRTTPRPPP